MNKIEYISRLSKSLDPYDIPNKIDIMADYEQIVDEILMDNNDDFNAVIEKLGYPEILALEIADELGYEIKINNKQKNNQEDRFNKKRYKSNVIWNIILAFFYLFQTGFILALVAVVSFLLYFGFNSDLNLKVVEGQDRNVELVASLCRKDKCETFKTYFNKDIERFGYDDDVHFGFFDEKFDNDYNRKHGMFSDREDDDDYRGMHRNKTRHKGFMKRNEYTITKEDKDKNVTDSKDNKTTEENSKSVDYVSEYSFPIGIFLSVSGAVLIALIWLNYLIVYKNVKRVTTNNNEYNRRRNYD